MWILCRDGLTEYVLDRPSAPSVAAAGTRLRFFDTGGALDFLIGLPQRALVEETLRAYTWEHLRREGEPVTAGGAILPVAARALHEGRLSIVARPLPAGGGGRKQRSTEAESKAPPQAPLEQKVHWIEIVLLEDDLRPIAGERYRIEAPDGAVREGKLDGEGAALEDHLDAGTCRVSFPDLPRRYTRAVPPARTAPRPDEKPAYTLAYDAYGGTLALSTTNRHVVRLEPFHHVSVRLVDCEHAPIPEQGTTLVLPDGKERRPPIGGDGVVHFAPAPPGVCTLHVDDPGRVPVRFPTVPDRELVIVVRVPPLPMYTGVPPWPRVRLRGEKTHWVEIVLVGADQAPIAGQRYRLEAPGGEVREGVLDGDGRAIERELPPGVCQVLFPGVERHL